MTYNIREEAGIKKFIDNIVKPRLFDIYGDYIDKEKEISYDEAVDIAKEFADYDCDILDYDDEIEKFNLQADIVLAIVDYVNNYEENMLNRMKCKTFKFVNLLKQFAKSKTFHMISAVDTFECNSVATINTYYIHVNLYGKELVMSIVDIPHQTSTFALEAIDGEKCSNEFANISMDDSRAENNFMKFLEFYFDALNS